MNPGGFKEWHYQILEYEQLIVFSHENSCVKENLSQKATVYTLSLSIVVNFKDLVGGHSYYLDEQKGLQTRWEAKESKIKKKLLAMFSRKIGSLDTYKYLSGHGQYEGKCVHENQFWEYAPKSPKMLYISPESNKMYSSLVKNFFLPSWSTWQLSSKPHNRC